MATVEQLEARLRPFKLALVEAFGMSPTARFSVKPTGIQFVQADGRIWWFGSHGWTNEQEQAVHDYLGQFPVPRFVLSGDVEAMRQALADSGGRDRLMVLPSDAGPERAPTWRDVFQVMRAAGFKLKVEEREAGYRKWWVDEGTGGIIAEIWREFLGGRYTWTVEINGYLMRHVRLDNPEPAAVLAAAMLTRILEGPVCGVEIVGLGEFTPDQPKHSEL